MAGPPDPEVLARALAASCGEGSVENLRRLSGGASRETWSFDLVDPRGRRTGLVLRRDPGEHVGQSERSTEYLLCEGAAAAGVAVPRVRTLLVPDDNLGRGFVMDRVDGETIPRKILRDDAYADARPLLAAQCGEIAARIHSIDPDELPQLPVLGAAAQLEQYRALLDGFGEPHPAFELGLKWLDGTRTRSAHEPRARARRLPQRQLHRRAGGDPRRPRLGARASRRSDRGSRVALREVVAVRRADEARRRIRRRPRSARRVRTRRRRRGSTRRRCASGSGSAR